MAKPGTGREAKNILFHMTYQLKMIKENHDSHEDMPEKLSINPPY